MKILLCGKMEEVADLQTVNDLLRHLRIGADDGGFAVAINDEIVFRNTWSHAKIHENDRVEIVRATQGG